jgi:hypothetical protein
MSIAVRAACQTARIIIFALILTTAVLRESGEAPRLGSDAAAAAATSPNCGMCWTGAAG